MSMQLDEAKALVSTLSLEMREAIGVMIRATETQQEWTHGGAEDDGSWLENDVGSTLSSAASAILILPSTNPPRISVEQECRDLIDLLIHIPYLRDYISAAHDAQKLTAGDLVSFANEVARLLRERR